MIKQTRRLFVHASHFLRYEKIVMTKFYYYLSCPRLFILVLFLLNSSYTIREKKIENNFNLSVIYNKLL